MSILENKFNLMDNIFVLWIIIEKMDNKYIK
jgi:hypothetical protein